MSETQSRMKRFENIQIAAHLNEESCKVINSNLFRLLGSRQVVAMQLLRRGEDYSDSYKHLNDLYDHINYEIKQILGLN